MCVHVQDHWVIVFACEYLYLVLTINHMYVCVCVYVCVFIYSEVDCLTTWSFQNNFVCIVVVHNNYNV